MKNFYGSSDICPMGFIYSIQICEISHQTFGPSHRKCPTCPMIFVNTENIDDNIIKSITFVITFETKLVKPCFHTCVAELLVTLLQIAKPLITL